MASGLVLPFRDSGGGDALYVLEFAGRWWLVFAAPFLWPLATARLADRTPGKEATHLRLIAEPCLMVLTLALWFGACCVVAAPASGAWSAGAGLALYFLTWLLEVTGGGRGG
jgi:hypothetical protein